MTWRLVFGVLFAATLFSIAPTCPAQAASFDCAAAKSPLEKQICADSVLSKADEAMGAVYRAQMAAAPPELRGRLRASQRSWLAYVDPYCSISPAERPACLRERFKARTEELRKAVRQAGPFTFFESWTYAVGFNAERKDRAFAHHISFLQIANPRTEAERQWNKVTLDAQKEEEADEHAGPEDDFEAGLEISGVSADLISSRFSTGYYAGSMAHGQYMSSGQVWSLRLRRPLTLADLFKDAGGGKAQLARRALAHFDGGEAPDGATFEAVLETLKNNDVWEATPAGVLLAYDPYAFGCYPCTGRAVVPWRELAPYLRPDLPFSIKDIRSDPARP